MSALQILELAVLVYFVFVNGFLGLLMVLTALDLRRHRATSWLAEIDDLRSSPLAPRISVLAPAYCEESTIVESTRSLLALAYPQLEIVVVNDGSKDATLEVLREAFSLEPVLPVYRRTIPTAEVQAIYRSRDAPNLVVVDKANGGKADALNCALCVATGELVCAIDADTIIDPDALLRMVHPFLEDPRIVAAGGTIRPVNGATVKAGRVVRPGSPRRPIAALQAVEYLRAFLPGRVGWNRLGGNLIISGAFGLFRRASTLAIGGYEEETVGEDMELVARMRRHGHETGGPRRVQFVADPVAWTEVPEDLTTLGRQRDRWHRGLADVLWRHRGALLRPRYGALGLIAMPVFVMVELLAPVIEAAGLLLFLVEIAIFDVNWTFAWLFLLFAYGLGLLLTIATLLLDELTNRSFGSSWERLRLLPWALIEPLGFRQLTVFWRLRGLIKWARGSRAWGEMRRSGFAQRAVPILAVLAVLPGCGAGDDDAGEGPSAWRGAVQNQQGLKVPARATETALQLATPAGFQDRFWPGVNLGSTTPGHFPGEVSARAGDYRRWFAQMGDLGVRVVRVYTLLDPSFYRELRRWNLAHPQDPLYVIHGVWIPEERFLETGDLYDRRVLREQRTLTREVHAAVFGRLARPQRPGFAHGRWTADISPWVIAWSPGVEWDPTAVERSERRNPPRAYRGRYVRTTGASTSTEAWIARVMDHLARLDVREGWSRAVTFTNWLTADPLEHPHEPLEREDAISVDAQHIRATARWPGGTFASYHVYPYYPDFLRLEPRYGQAPDSYAAYLRDLRAHHRGQALMVTEFGVPTSLGKAHLGPQGRDQGGHHERDAARMEADMLRAMRREGLTGGVLFEWVDEWFKFTWNTTDLEQPGDRRQLWRNALTNEEHFGVLAAEPGAEPKVTLDGDAGEWEQEGHSPMLWEAREGVRQVRATHDPEGLALMLRTSEDQLRDGVVVGLDLRPGENRGLPGLPGVAPEADVALIWRDGRLQLRHAAWTDTLLAQYGVARPFIPVDRRTLRPGSGVWRAPQLILNRPYVVPLTGERRGVELQTLDPLPTGDEADDARTAGASEDGVLELKIPWMLLGFADPSSRTVVTPRPDGELRFARLPEGRRFGIAVTARDGRALARPARYGIEDWQQVTWHERRKAGWDVLREAFARTSAVG